MAYFIFSFVKHQSYYQRKLDRNRSGGSTQRAPGKYWLSWYQVLREGNAQLTWGVIEDM